jgi:hypothetical protein
MNGSQRKAKLRHSEINHRNASELGDIRRISAKGRVTLRNSAQRGIQGFFSASDLLAAFRSNMPGVAG